MAAAPWIASDELWSRIEPLSPRWSGAFAIRVVGGCLTGQTKHSSGLGRARWVVERAFAWLHSSKRLLVRYDRRADIHEAFLAIACCVVCFRRLQTSVSARSAERARLLSPIDLHPGRA
jgi:Transposase DDE domain